MSRYTIALRTEFTSIDPGKTSSHNNALQMTKHAPALASFFCSSHQDSLRVTPLKRRCVPSY